VQITVAELRELLASSVMGTTLGKFRILIMEDADRMTPTASNLLLKSLEEPPAGTIWMLCAPSEADMLPTIRSRVRRVGLKVPSVESVAQLLISRDGVETGLAHRVAAEAQSHIGMARRLGTSSEARSRRKDVLKAAMSIRNVSDVVSTAERWLELAHKDAESMAQQKDEEEKSALMHSIGLATGDAVPNSLRSELKRLTEDQKRRATRSTRDGLDRIFVDLLALYRDILTVQLSADVPLVNEDLAADIRALAGKTKPEQTLNKLAAIELARGRIASNVKDLIVLESLGVSLQIPRD
jgi:DNA polymerase-3 subunit delta'